MNGAPTAGRTATGNPVQAAYGKKGNVGGISTPGRKGSKAAAMMAGVKNLVAPGAGTKKTAVIANMPRPEGKVHIDAGNLKKALGMVAEKPSGVVKPGGTVNVMSKIRPEGGIKRDAAQAIKP